MATHRATCQDCHETYTDSDLLKVSEWAEDHKRTEVHDVRIERAVATDGGEDLDDIPGEYVDIDELPDLPECRVTATADPAGLLRFEMTRERAKAVFEQVQDTLDTAPADPDGLFDLMIILDYPAYASLTKGLAQLHQADGLMTKQVRVEPDEPDLAIAVAVNDSQIESSMRKNYAALKRYGDGRIYGQRFGVSRNGMVMLVQQLEAALKGHDDPLETVDVDDDGTDRQRGDS